MGWQQNQKTPSEREKKASPTRVTTRQKRWRWQQYRKVHVVCSFACHLSLRLLVFFRCAKFLFMFLLFQPGFKYHWICEIRLFVYSFHFVFHFISCSVFCCCAVDVEFTYFSTQLQYHNELQQPKMWIDMNNKNYIEIRKNTDFEHHTTVTEQRMKKKKQRKK